MKDAAIRLILGMSFLIAVWFASWPFESGDWLPLGAVALAGVAVSGALSWWTLARSVWRRSHVMVFAAPFILPIAVCLPGIFEAIYRPVIYWSMVGFSIFCACFAFDQLVVVLFNRERSS